MGKSEHPSLDSGKGGTRDTLDLRGISGLGGGSEASLAQKSSLASQSPGIYLVGELLKEAATKVELAIQRDEEPFRCESCGRKVEMLVFEGRNLEGWIFRAEFFFLGTSIYGGGEAGCSNSRLRRRGLGFISVRGPTKEDEELE